MAIPSEYYNINIATDIKDTFWWFKIHFSGFLRERDPNNHLKGQHKIVVVVVVVLKTLESSKKI